MGTCRPRRVLAGGPGLRVARSGLAVLFFCPPEKPKKRKQRQIGQRCFIRTESDWGDGWLSLSLSLSLFLSVSLRLVDVGGFLYPCRVTEMPFRVAGDGLAGIGPFFNSDEARPRSFCGLSPGFDCVVVGSTGFERARMSWTGFHPVSLSQSIVSFTDWTHLDSLWPKYTGFEWVIDFSGFHRFLLGCPGLELVLLSFFFKIVMGSDGIYGCY